LDREEIFGAAGRDAWKKEHYYRFHQGHNCGICAAVRPLGQKLFRRAATA
jgi:hypothetical protein